MFLRSLVIYYLNLILINCSSEIERTKRNNELDLRTCIDHFDVHKNKIIRTQDSRNMGAKFLDEMEIGSREECLHWCCETDDCDVFVFEEKNFGSCYLFHCGPPEDFKCQFTHHVNYSSAILAINRQHPDLENEIKLTKHEQDLTKLRKVEADELPAAGIQTTPSTTSTTANSKIPNPIKSTEEVRKCSRYQFECRSTRECIAIYNACDGIPQCADGSDEAPELSCPDTVTTTLPPARVNNQAPPPNARYDPAIPQSRLNQPNLLQSDLYRPQENLNQPIQPIQPSHPDFIRPVPADSRNNVAGHVQYENQVYQPQLQIQQQQQLPLQQQQQQQVPQPNGWVPHQSNQMPSSEQISQYSDKNSHIFTHKGTGLQVPDGQEIRQIPYPEPINNRDYAKISNYYGDNYRQPIQQENWPINPSADDSQYGSSQFAANNNKNWRPDQDSARNPPAGNFKTTSSGANPSPNWKTEKVIENPKHIQEKMAHELKHSKETTIKIEKSKTHSDSYPDVVSVKMPQRLDLQDGIPETPSGAVLSLTLGLIITFITAILIVCRLRVKRRMRKGGKTYAHDADYLVNGMYL